MIRFIHVADIHFGVENYGKIDPTTGIHSRLLDFKLSLDTAIEYAIAQKVDFFLFCGDAYKTAYPTPTQQRLLMQSFFMLFKAKIPVVIVVGNHDHPLSFGKAHALDVFKELPLEGFHVFSKPDMITLSTSNGPIQIVGIPWPTRHTLVTHDQYRVQKSSEITTHISSGVSDLIQNFAEQLDPNLPAIFASHLTVSSGVFSGSEKCAVYGSDPLFMPSQLALPAFDYIALGHLHRHQDLNPHGYPPVVYAGSIDRVDFGERNEEKGFVEVTIQTNCPPSAGDLHQYHTKSHYRFIRLKTRPFVQIELTLKTGITHTEQVIAAINAHEIEDAIVKIVYHVPAGIQDKVDLQAVGRALSKAMYVVGIFPIRTPEKRIRRTPVNVGMDFNTLIGAYLESHPELMPIKERITKKAQELLQELETPKEEQI